LDQYKRMPLVRSTAELEYEDDHGNVQKLTNVDASSIQTSLPKRKRLNIPMPPVMRNEDPERDALHSGFEQPQHYIRLARKVPWAEEDDLLYSLTFDDMEWLREHPVYGPNGENPEILNEDLLEEMMDALEKSAQRGSITQHQADALFMYKFAQHRPSHGRMWADVYQYWHAKRHRLKRPLLRKFWPVTSVNDNNPHKVFRPREKERYKLRRNRRNDLDSFRRMQQLRRDFEKLRGILELVKHREKVKEALLEARRDSFLQLIQHITDPSGPKRVSSLDVQQLREELKIPVIDANPPSSFLRDDSSIAGMSAESALSVDGQDSEDEISVSKQRKRNRKARNRTRKRGRDADDVGDDSDSQSIVVPKGNDKGLMGTLTQPSFMEVNPHRHRFQVRLRGGPMLEDPWGALSPHVYEEVSSLESLSRASLPALRVVRLSAGTHENLAPPVMDPSPEFRATLPDGQIPRKWRFRARIGRAGRLLIDRKPLHPREWDVQPNVVVAGAGGRREGLEKGAEEKEAMETSAGQAEKAAEKEDPERRASPQAPPPRNGSLIARVNIQRIRDIADMTDSEEETFEYYDPETRLFAAPRTQPGVNFILPT